MGPADGTGGHQAHNKGQGDDSPTTMAGDGTAEGCVAAFCLTNRVLALGLFAAVLGLAASIWFSDWAHERVRDGFTLGGFPLFAGSLMGLSLLVMIFDGQAHETTAAMRGFRPFDLVVVLAATALVSICFIAIPWIGFVPAITVLVFVGSFGLGFRPAWIALAVALATSIGLRVLLLALGMNVADGPLGSLLSGGWHV